MKLTVVLINYKTPEMTQLSLASVLREMESIPESRVALVDNDSQDGSYEELARVIEERGWKDRVDLIRSPKNGGFAWGVNQGARPALASDDPPEYIYLLNSDAMPDPGALKLLVDFLDTHPEVGICGSQLYGSDGETHTTAFRIHTLGGEFCSTVRGLPGLGWLLDRWVVTMPNPVEPAPVGWLAGASMLIRGEIFEKVAFFDENFFLYYEETDFCRQAALAGYPTWYIPGSRVEHVGGASTGWKDFSKPRASFWFDGRRYYYYKNHGLLYLWLANLLWISGYVIGRAKAFLKREEYRQPPRLFRDFLRHNLTFRRIPEPAPNAGE